MKEISQKRFMGAEQHILIVDDEYHVGLFIEELLANHGYQVSRYLDSIEALARFVAHPWMFDLVLTDQNMPKLCGIELANKLRAIRSCVPIILCSGLGAENIQASVKGTGVTTCISKPLRVGSLLNLIDENLKDKRDSDNNNIEGG